MEVLVDENGCSYIVGQTKAKLSTLVGKPGPLVVSMKPRHWIIWSISVSTLKGAAAHLCGMILHRKKWVEEMLLGTCVRL